MRIGPALIACLAAALGAPAAAQAPADPIADLLQRQAEDPEAEQPPAPAAPAPYQPLAPEPYVAPAPLTRPVFIDDAAKAPETAPSAADLAYEARLRASSASAQGFRGPLEGGWTLVAGALELYAFQLADRGEAGLEGAWRDLARRGALEGSGFIEQVERIGDQVTFRFDGGRRLARLRDGGGGSWTGDLEEAGVVRRVSLRRRP